MRCRRTVRIIIDIAMYLIFVVLMQEHLWSDGLHEWLGITLFALFIAHTILNFGWYQSLFKVKIHSAKTIIPLFTHNGSSSGASSISTVAKLCPDSTVLIDDYFTYSGNNVDKAESDVDEWLAELGYKN